MGIQVRTLGREKHGFDALVLQDLSERWTEGSVTIHEYVALALEEAVLDVGQVLGDLCHPGFVGIGGASSEVDAAALAP